MLSHGYTLHTLYTLLKTFQLLVSALPILFCSDVSPMRGSLHDIPPLRRGVLDAPESRGLMTTFYEIRKAGEVD